MPDLHGGLEESHRSSKTQGKKEVWWGGKKEDGRGEKEGRWGKEEDWCEKRGY
jgi:hypothetical protein